MIKLFNLLLLVLALFSNANAYDDNLKPRVDNGCITFSVSQGTGCQWMCNYCSNNLGTNNYYFTDNVCTYDSGGCVGNPLAGKQYTCCAVNNENNFEDEL